MSARLQKVIRDFWRERTRTVLVVLAIALGISGFTAVLASYAILTRALNEGYLATNPASFSLWTDAVDEKLLAAVLANRDVGAAEARRALTARIKAGPGEWRGLTLFVVRDFGDIRVSTLRPEKGAWPPGAGEILIERDAFQVARVAIGDTVMVRTPGGTEKTLRVTGSVHDVGQAQARMENIVYGYITLETLERLGEPPSLNQMKVLVATNRFDEKHVRAVADDIKRVVESQGHPVRRMEVPKPGEHPHASLMGLLLLAMASFGLFVVFLSGILVVNLLMALMASQVRQIGVMKAIGGSQAQIAAIYFSQALLLGAAAVLVALPAGVWGSRMLCRAMAVFLNFDIASFSIPAWVYACVGAVGILIPLLAAAYPVWRGSSVPVWEALADQGTSRNTFGASAFDRALAGLSGMTRPLLFALRNGLRRRMRFVLTLATLAVGGLFFMTALNVRSSMIHTLDRMFATKRSDLSVTLGTMVPIEKIDRAARTTPGVLRAESWIATEAALPAAGEAAVAGGLHTAGGTGGGHGGGAPGGAGGDRFTVLAVPAKTELLNLDIVEGRGLQAGEMDALVMNTALAAKGRMKVGGTVTLQMGPAQTSWRVVGIAREAFSPPVGYVPLAFFEEHGHTGVANVMRLVLEKTDPASVSGVKAGLDRNLEAEGVRALASVSKAESRYGFDQHMVMIYVFLIVMSGIIGGIGGLGLMTSMSLNVLERRREMGILRAIGAAPRTVWLIVVAEGVVIAVLAWAFAALAAWPVSRGLGNLLVLLMFKSGLDFRFEGIGLAIWLGVSILLGTAASFLPAWHASRCPVREALGYE